MQGTVYRHDIFEQNCSSYKAWNETSYHVLISSVLNKQREIYLFCAIQILKQTFR